ncbi:hypothetical protein, partial [Rhizobium sp. L43]|uniref:hypothetical protein n=1 Tax=Rhizobium sp. L43 TaxID=2035452 RepID=UPI001AEF83C4
MNIVFGHQIETRLNQKKDALVDGPVRVACPGSSALNQTRLFISSSACPCSHNQTLPVTHGTEKAVGRLD